MGEMVIAGEYFYELAQAFGVDMKGIDGPVTGYYYATPPFGNPPYEGAPEYQDLEISLPGIDGCAIKRLGFRARPIYARLAFIGDSKLRVEQLKNTMFAKWVALASFSITVPGGTPRPSCRIVHGSASRGEWEYMGGMFILFVDVQFKQVRLT